ncbi:unnamed protein product [Agarophyton chilense]
MTNARTVDHVRLFVALGSAPANARLRAAARASWLTWLPRDGSVRYRFFSDAPPSFGVGHASRASVWTALMREVRVNRDLVLQPLPSGYGDNEHNVYGSRGLFQFRWALTRFPRLEYFLRVDDDSFLCVHKLLYEMGNVPRRQFFWGKFWCKQGRNRADENFMLFSSDVVQLLASEHVGGLLPFDEHVTLGWNFGYWSWVLNLTIFDDQRRIDAQQSYLTQYMHDERMHDERLAPNSSHDFCERFIFAHHVGERAMSAAFRNARTHVMYELPQLFGPERTCASSQRSFIPNRHSHKLPHVKISRLAAADMHDN